MKFHKLSVLFVVVHVYQRAFDSAFANGVGYGVAVLFRLVLVLVLR